MKIRKIMTAITAAAMAGVMFAGCSSSNGGRRKQRGQQLRSEQQLRSGQRRRRE